MKPIIKRLFQGTFLNFLNLKLFLKDTMIKKPMPINIALVAVKTVGLRSIINNLLTGIAKPLIIAVHITKKVPRVSFFIKYYYTSNKLFFS